MRKRATNARMHAKMENKKNNHCFECYTLEHFYRDYLKNNI